LLDIFWIGISHNHKETVKHILGTFNEWLVVEASEVNKDSPPKLLALIAVVKELSKNNNEDCSEVAKKISSRFPSGTTKDPLALEHCTRHTNKILSEKKKSKKVEEKVKELYQVQAKYLHNAKAEQDKLTEKDREINKMQEQIRELDVDVAKCKSLEHKLKQKQNEVEKLRELIWCPICMDRSKDTAFKPCNHSLCSKCVGTILGSSLAENRIGRCPICRVEVESKYPIYL